MTSYLITGVSRGIGYEFLRQLSDDKANTVIGLVRNKEATGEKIAAEFGQRDNISIIQADLTDYASIKESGSLDVIIANAGYMSPDFAWDNIGTSGEQPEKFEQELLETFRVNVIGTIHLYNLFMPLIIKGKTKKFLAISTGFADNDLTANYDLYTNPPYVISKAALNMAVAKFSAQYRKEGVLFLAVSPGAVDTGHFDEMTEDQLAKAGELFAAFKGFDPGFTGPAKVDAAIRDVLAVLDRASLETGFAGAFVSHQGNKNWL